MVRFFGVFIATYRLFALASVTAKKGGVVSGSKSFRLAARATNWCPASMLLCGVKVGGHSDARFNLLRLVNVLVRRYRIAAAHLLRSGLQDTGNVRLDPK